MPASPRILAEALSVLKGDVSSPSIFIIRSPGRIPSLQAGVSSIGDTTSIYRGAFSFATVACLEI